MDKESAINYLIEKGLTREEAEKRVDDMAGTKKVDETVDVRYVM